MTLDPQVKAMLDAMKQLDMPPISSLGADEARERMAAMRAQRAGMPVEPAIREDFTIGSVGARRYRPESGETNGTVVYYHGGGWVIGTLDDFDGLAARLANDSGAQVISVDYRLAPEHPWPAATDDAYAALEWAAAQEGAGPIVVAGDSAGGNLAAVVAQQARDKGGPAIALQVLVYPVTDYGNPYPSYDENGSGEYMIGTSDMEWFFGHYVPDAADRAHPGVSPIRAEDLSGLPPAVVIVAGFDPLRDEGIAYADKLKDAGVPVELRRYDSMIHGFFGMLGILPTSDEAVAAVGEDIKKATVGAPAG